MQTVPPEDTSAKDYQVLVAGRPGAYAIFAHRHGPQVKQLKELASKAGKKDKKGKKHKKEKKEKKKKKHGRDASSDSDPDQEQHPAKRQRWVWHVGLGKLERGLGGYAGRIEVHWEKEPRIQFYPWS